MFASFRTWLDVGLVGLKLVRCDRGTHNRGVFVLTLAKNGVAIASLEAPEQIGRAERRGAMLKKIMSKVHARLNQRIGGHDSQRMLARRQ